LIRSNPGSKGLRLEPGWMERVISYHLDNWARVPPLSPTHHFHMISCPGHRKEEKKKFTK
jgi:hypothetical protein